MNKEEAKQKVAELVKKYEALSPAEIKGYNEAATKASFIEPLFRALGWDTEDNNEVAPEHNASNGRVDYSFKINGVSQFFVEAKPLKADLTNETYIKQAVTYALNKGVAWAVLTDFRELRIFHAQNGNNWLNLDYTKYNKEFDKLLLLSKEAIATGLTYNEASTWGAMPVHIPIEKRLFKQLREWREALFKELHLYNEKLSFRQIDDIIQKLFNRLIFIRTSEDRGIEEKHLRSMISQWKAKKHKGEMIDELRKLFKEFDGYYDSELFAPHPIDNNDIFIQSDTLENIITGLYDITGGFASYDFSVIKPDVLGAVYEQYLGYVAEIEKQRAKEAQAKMDLGIQTESVNLIEKKQRRKEQGIYYTPEFITDYIVRETVGQFLSVHSSKEIRNIKILDPACGSGSFLIRAFDELLKYYANQKISKSEKDIDAADRLSILQNNIYGVDLDIQAIEITRLNLLLRSLAKRETLPGLKDTIKQGNSLISGTEEELKKYFGETWKEKRAFDWKEEFKEIVNNGGFDIVIGNPPYIQLSMDEKIQQGLKSYLLDKYKSSMGRLNTFGFFTKRGINLLKDSGYLGFIVPNTILTQDYYEELRKNIVESCAIKDIVCFDELPFKDAIVENVVLILQKNKSEEIRNRNKVAVYKVNEELSFKHSKSIAQTLFNQSNKFSFNVHIDDRLPFLKKKLETKSCPLSKFVNINQAIALKHEREKWVSKTKIDDSYKPLLVGGRNINRYSIIWDKQYLHYVKAGIHSGGEEAKFLAKEKIFFRRVSTRLIGALDSNQFYGLHTLVVMTLKEETPFDIRFFLAIFNSKLINFYYRAVFASTKKVFSEIGARHVGKLPVKEINLSISKEKNIHDTLVAFVERTIELNKRLVPIRNTACNEREELLQQIGQTDKQIDNLVYDLYGLTEEERKIVEGTDSSLHSG
ncbi:MAG: N-6 DNA methylase [Dehalococcoidales bacterium]|nr:N-6 DNA methylase [Dehalococcoidales bacterium]